MIRSELAVDLIGWADLICTRMFDRYRCECGDNLQSTISCHFHAMRCIWSCYICFNIRLDLSAVLSINSVPEKDCKPMVWLTYGDKRCLSTADEVIVRRLVSCNGCTRVSMVLHDNLALEAFAWRKKSNIYFCTQRGRQFSSCILAAPILLINWCHMEQHEGREY